jgi:hypothetical protein
MIAAKLGIEQMMEENHTQSRNCVHNNNKPLRHDMGLSKV